VQSPSRELGAWACTLGEVLGQVLINSGENWFVEKGKDNGINEHWKRCCVAREGLLKLNIP